MSNLNFLRVEPRGNVVCEKFWVEQEGIKKLVKLSGEANDQDVMEVLSSKILKSLNINCVEAELGYDSFSKKNGCLITSFLIDEADVSYETMKWENIKNIDYSKQIEQCFEQVFYNYSMLYQITDEELNKLKRDYIRIIFGKCIIENSDTKLENIELIFNEKSKKYRLPPSFDNAIAFRSYNSFVSPVCCVGNQYLESSQVVDSIMNNYFEYISDIPELLEHFIENDLECLINYFSDEIIEEKRNYIINHLCQFNNSIQNKLISNKKTR